MKGKRARAQFWMGIRELKSNRDKKTWGLFCHPWRCVLGPRTLRNVGEAGHVQRDGWADAESEDRGVRDGAKAMQRAGGAWSQGGHSGFLPALFTEG